MAQKLRKIQGERCYLPEFINLEKVRGVEKLVMAQIIDGKTKRTYYDATLENLKKLKDDAATVRNDRKKYGADFGAISDDEKRAIEMWRAYKKKCIEADFPYKDMLDVILTGLKELETSTPTFEVMGKQYINYLLQKTGGELTDHIGTVQNRIAIISQYMSNIQLHKINEKMIIDFIYGLKKKNGEYASQITKNQYLSIIKSIFKYAVERSIIEEKKNPCKLINFTEVVMDEPEILSVDDTKRVFAFLKTHKEYHQFIPVMAIGFFAGPRLAERCRLTYADIFVGGRNEIFLSRKITKTKMDRVTYMSDNLIAWMNFAKDNGVDMNGYILSGATESARRKVHSDMLDRLEKATGVHFPKNCIRHSAATYMSELLGTLETSKQLGHSESILKSNYRRAISKVDSEAYFDILP